MRTFRASSRALLFHHFVTTISPFQGLHDALWVVYTVVLPFFFLVGICLHGLVELLGGLPPYADLAPKQSVTARPIHGPVSRLFDSSGFYCILFDPFNYFKCLAMLETCRAFWFCIFTASHFTAVWESYAETFQVRIRAWQTCPVSTVPCSQPFAE